MDLMNQELAGSGSDLLEHLDRYCESEGGSGENEEEITSTPCHAAGEMNEQIDNRITSRQARRDNNKKNTKSQTRPCHNVCNRQTTKDRSKHSKNARPRSAGAKSPERRVTRGISINSNQKTVEMRRRLLELEKEVDLLHGENVSLRRQLTKAPPVQRLADETIHNRIQSGMKKEKKMFEMLLSDNERKFHELESKQRYLLEDKDTLQARIRIFEKEIENHINTLQQTRKELFTVKENNKEIAEENRLLKKENHVLKSRGDKKKDVHRAKDKQELDIVTEHYQTVIKNLQVDREKVQRERDAAVLRVHQYKEKWSEKCKRDEIKSRGKIQVLERQVRELEMERGFLEEEKHSLEGRISKLLEKNENEAETLVQIGEVLRKHDNDLEKQVQELNREKEELAKEKEIHREQIRQYEKMKENLQTQLKTSREVLENRISELYLKNERLQTENAELKRCSNVKKEDWIRTISDIMGFEKASKSETESKFQSMIGTFQKEKKELDEELTCLRRRLKDIEEEKEKVVANKEKAINFQKEEIEKHKRESKSLIDERTLLMERLKEIEVKKEDMRNEANTAKQQMKIEFEELVEKIRDENSRLRQEKESLQSKVEELEYALTVKDIDDEENEQTDMVNYQKTIEELQEQVQRERQRFHEKEEKWKLLNETQTEKEEALNVRNASLERTVQKYLREIDTLKNRISDHEQGIGHYQHQIEHILQEKTLIQKQLQDCQNKKETAVNEEMVQNIQTESKKLMEIEEQLERENQDLKAEKLTWGVQRKNLEERVRSMENQLEIKEAKVRSLTQDKIQLLQEIKTAQARCTEDDIYPKVNGDVSDSLQGGGTDVALLGERFNDLYENEFLESLKSLTNDSELFLDDRDAIESLLNILQTIFKECERLAEEQLDDLQMVMGLEVENEEHLTKIRYIRNHMAMDCLCNITKKVKQGTLKKSYSEYLEHCGVYVEKAIELCWLMNSVDPPITLDFTSQHGDTMDERKYRRFSGSGEIINFCVWPSILFQGHVLQKGVVQTTHLKS
ncbi:uncharacterized protein LOC111126986 isoform X4 [Crassostrea virginica]|uniref:Golgin subfamily A member 6-like protein 22 isoform X4 n=1 Tax=Crassostrea virginica TaxID=6565 RepID=A0A8B8DL74_CRAVI|nr:golgin subfamily A member 6-like protein 22 isoform X4 [Crassostrea virginica]